MTVEESISCYYTVFRYGWYGARREREVSQDARGGGLDRSSCARLARVIRLVVSIARLYNETRRRRKKRSTHKSTSY